MRRFDERTGDDRAGRMFWCEEFFRSCMVTIGDDGAILRGMGEETAQMSSVAIFWLPVRRAEFAIEECHLDEEDERAELG